MDFSVIEQKIHLRSRIIVFYLDLHTSRIFTFILSNFLFYRGFIQKSVHYNSSESQLRKFVRLVVDLKVSR